MSETKINNHNINYASTRNCKLVFTNSSFNAGGVALYILNNLNYSRRLDLEFKSAQIGKMFSLK